MRVLFDIVHPAHVHFYRYLREELLAQGHETLVVSREKDVTAALLDELGIPHTVGSAGPRSSWLGQGAELVVRDLRLIRAIRSFRPDVVLTRNPAGVHAAKLCRIPSIFDTDNGTSAGVHFRLAEPWATITTTPEGIGEDYGPRHRTYPSYKSMAFLHPNRFQPDPGVRAELGVSPDERFFLLRFVAMNASHDHGHVGLPHDEARRLRDELSAHGRVFVSAEGDVPGDLAAAQLPTKPSRFLDVLAEASLVVGDSGSVAAEAALLGTSSIFYSSFARKLSYLDELEDDYGLVRNITPPDVEALRRAVTELATPDAEVRAAAGRDAMLADKVDLTEWYLELVAEVVDRHGRA